MNIRKITQIKFPKIFQNQAEELSDYCLKQYQKLSGKDVFNSDLDPFHNCPQHLKMCTIFLEWISDAHEIIDNLNIILNDLASIGGQSSSLNREMWLRYRLLVRTFFYEFSRIKGKFNRFLKNLQKLGYFNGTLRKEMYAKFTSSIEPIIKIRNNITHGHMQVLEEERELILAAHLYEGGYGMLNKITGKIVDTCSLKKVTLNIGYELFEIINEVTEKLDSITNLLAVGLRRVEREANKNK